MGSPPASAGSGGFSAVVSRYRAGRVANVLAGAAPFRPVPPGEFQPPQGRSEAAFVQYLRQNFGPAHIFTHCRVRVDEMRSGPEWYYPDIVYGEASGLRIDIEIDEPYVWTTGEPHHCQGQDDARNAFFLRKNWVVLRLTEEQVVRYPLRCGQLLAALVFQFTGQHHAPRTHPERRAPQPPWDWAEATRLAARRARESYGA